MYRPTLRKAWLPAMLAGFALTTVAQTQSNPTTPARSQPTAQTSGSTPAAVPYRGVRASEMIGMSVRNDKGNNIGQIDDMIVDMNTGEVRYAVLRFDPGILSGEKLYAVPTRQLRIAPDRNDVVLGISEDRLERASIDRSAWNDKVVAAPGFIDKFDRAWGVAQPTRAARAHRMSDLIGKDVNSRAGEKIGEIEELIVNMATGQVHYAVLEFDPGWASAEKDYAVPLRMFDLSANRDELVLDVDKADVRAMKAFPQDRFSKLNDPVWVADIDRYLVLVVPAAQATAGTAGTAQPAATDTARTGSASQGAAARSADASYLSVSELFMRLDEDRNGSLSRAEVKDSADVDRNWTRFDGDNDGRISRDEFTRNYTIDPNR